MGPYVAILGAVMMILGIGLGRNRYGIGCFCVGAVLVFLGM